VTISTDTVDAVAAAVAVGVALFLRQRMKKKP